MTSGGVMVAVGLKYGAACTACSDNNCVDAPTEDEPLIMPMSGNKELRITECPNRFCGSDGRNAVRFAGYASHGVLPVLAGLLGQSNQFIESTELVWSESESHKRRLGVVNG